MKKEKIAEQKYANLYHLIEENRFEEAIPLLDEVLRLDPNHVDAMISKGLSLSSLSQYDEADKYYEKALQLEPYSYWAWYLKANNSYLMKKLNETIKCYDKALSIDVNNPLNWNAWHLRGASLYELGHYYESIDSYKEALNLDPNLGWTIHSIGISYAKLNQHEEALKYYKRALELNELDDVLWFDMGRSYQLLQRYDDAIGCYERSLSINSNDKEQVDDIKNRIGKCLFCLERFEEANESLINSNGNHNENSEYWVLKGMSLRKLEKNWESLKAYNKALEIDPNDINALSNKGEVLNKLGLFEEAISHLNKSIELEPTNLAAWHNISQTFLALGQWEKAIGAVDRSFQLYEKCGDDGYGANEIDTLWNTKAVSLMYLDNFEEAQNVCRKGLEFNPDNYLLLSIESKALFDSEKFNEALEHYEKLLEIGQKLTYEKIIDSGWLINKGICLYKLNRFEEALEVFDEILESNKDNNEAISYKIKCMTKIKI